jgi:hypothetical protein
MTVYASNGSPSALTVGTETNLATSIPAGNYVVNVDIAALAAGESLTLRIYRPAVGGGTERMLPPQTVSWPLVATLLTTPAFHLEGSGRVSIQQAGGTGRAFPWAIESL